MKPAIRFDDPDAATERVDKCELCGGTVFDPELRAGNWTLLRCRACGLVFTSPRYTSEYLQEKYAQCYYEIADGYLEDQMVSPLPDEIVLARRLLRRCAQSSDQRCRSLDIGCGAGRMVNAFQLAGWDAWGYDRGLKAVEQGKLRGLQLCAGDISQTPLQHYDLISAFHVLEHIAHPQEFLTACHSRLRPGGFLLLEVPDYGCRGARTLKGSWPYLYPSIHLIQYTSLTLKRLVEQTSFAIVKVSHVGGRGPFAERSAAASAAKTSPRSGWRTRVFELRKHVYRIPGTRKIARHILWQMLGFGEFVRILACRKN